MISSTRIVQALTVGLGIVLVWSFWPTLVGVVERWTIDPKYSHGYIVPLFALWLLGSRCLRVNKPAVKDTCAGSPRGLTASLVDGALAIARELSFVDRNAPKAATTPSAGSWWGLAMVFSSVALHMAGEYFYIGWLSGVALLPGLAGLCLCLGGWRLLLLAGPSIAFLAFMLPLPFSIEVALANPLQRLATVASTYLLQTIGFSASADGNTIVLNHPPPLNVAEACSGLGMMMTFSAMATAVAIVLKRPVLDKLVVVVSALPIAVASNVFRITVTGILYETVGTQVGSFIYHDLMGLVIMMPVALFLIWLELKILSHLLVEPEPKAPIAFGLGLGQSPVAAANGHHKQNPAIVRAGSIEDPRGAQFQLPQRTRKRGRAK